MAFKSGTNAADRITGTEFNDTLIGWDASNAVGDEGPARDSDTLMGGVGYDLIKGGAGNDFLNGNDGRDTLYGGAGDDLLQGDAGTNMLYGGAGRDSLVSYRGGRDVIDGGSEVDILYWADTTGTLAYTVSFADPTVTLVLPDGTTVVNVEAISFDGGTKGDRITGGNYADRIDGRGGADMIDGGGGNDTLLASSGRDTVYGGSGADRVAMFNGLATEAYGGSGRDSLEFYAMASSGVTLTVGQPALVQHLADGSVVSGFEQVWFFGGTGADHVQGGALADTMEGGLGNDWFNGGAGNDIIYGGEGGRAQGADTLLGGAGDDRFEEEPGGLAGLISGGAGVDTLVLHQSHIEAGAQLSLANPATIALLTNGTQVSGIERLVFDGAEAADSVTGGTGSDDLSGNGGNDVLNGWTGADVLRGGAGADRFDFARLDAADQIVDFAHGVDRIGLVAAAFGGLPLGALAAEAFVAGAALDSGDRILYDQASGSLRYDADGNGAGVAVLFATVTAGTVVTFADFVVV